MGDSTTGGNMEGEVMVVEEEGRYPSGANPEGKEGGIKGKMRGT